MSSWHSYPSIFNLGHRAVRDLLNYPHIVEEKVDGSQFSFGLFYDDVPQPVASDIDPNTFPPELRVRSKGAVMHVDAPEKMFNKAVESVKQRQHLLHVGWTYRCEYLAKPQHNSLAYDRVPEGYLIGFDVSTGDGEWLSRNEKEAEFERIGLETVPLLTQDNVGGAMTLEQYRRVIDETPSVLGGQLIEGIVVKPTVPLYGEDKKTLLGKFVSERFREVHKREWSKSNPTTGDIIDQLVRMYRVEARWHKAIQHLRERGMLTDSPRDIGALIQEVKRDVSNEEMTEIKEALWKYAWPKIERGIVAGLPEFYKDFLLKLQFQQEDDNGNA